MAELAEGSNLRDFVRWEQEPRISREAVTVALGQDLSIGQVIGKITKTIATSGTPAAGNTGGGTVTSVTMGQKAKIGTYTIEAKTIVASPLEQVFQVTDPDGNLLPDAEAVGAYMSEQINFTITEGSPVIAEGDKWTVACSAGSGQVKAINYDGVDGTQDAYGIIAQDADASSAAISAVAITRDAVVIGDNLVWPTVSPVWSATQKATALAQLADRGIVSRDEA